MQISRLYSNEKSLFTPIDFNCRETADILNVVYGDITDSSDEKRDSHNLGKTTLIHVINFMFLKDISSSKHFLETHKERFISFVFFLEISLNNGEFITIRRAVENNTRIAFKKHEDRSQDFTNDEISEWDHPELTLSAARELLDGILNLRVITPYDYRKALTYFLRTQDDYQSILQLQKFQAGQHVHWKPFVMNLLGFDEGPTKNKYTLDKSIEKKDEEKKKKQAELQIDEQDISRLSVEIQNLKSQLDETEKKLDRFEFSDEERRLMHELVDGIEAGIVEINDQLYNASVDLRNIDQALSNKISFKVKDIEEIFSETNIHFPDQIKKSYSDLVEFNRSLTNERNASLRARRKELLKEHTLLREDREKEDKRRQEFRSILQNSDTLEKFKALQKNLAEQRARLSYLDKQFEKLNSINDIEIEINALKRQRSEVVDQIRLQKSKSSIPKDNIARFFNEFCKKVLDHEGLFYLEQNTSGNIEFKIELKEATSSKASRQSEGKSYKQILCALFDLALLKAYQNDDFYHFVYHDGILEGLDDRKKRLFLGVVRDVIKNGKIQYILSVINSDIPRDVSGARVEFNDDEIILHLHDGGNQGLLFKMAEF